MSSADAGKPATAAEARRVLEIMRTLRQRATALMAAPAALQHSVREQSHALRFEAASLRIASIPLSTLKATAGAGARLTQLERAGYRTVRDVLAASSHALDAVPGVGPKTVEQVVAAARATERQLQTEAVVRFDPDRPDPGQTRLLATLSGFRAADQAARSLHQAVRMFVDQTTPLLVRAERTERRLSMVFTGRAAREGARAALAELVSILADPRLVQLSERGAESEKAADPTSYQPAQLWRDYLLDAASVNALLAQLTGNRDGEAAAEATGFIPDELRQQISATPLDTSLLRVTLRGYQVFGAQYAIHQERAILGDEMGLGKTVQALTAVAHLAARGQRRFLVVCPASVLINWLNETVKHTRLATYSLHGPDRDEAAQRWLRGGGLAVTTYGTLPRLPEEVRSVATALLVVDEAHYIKNPGAARSEAVRSMIATAQRALFLTGTPMENRVEEFRNLVDYLRPAVAASVDARDSLPGARAFRRRVAPVYLRRNQIDVLNELPERIEVEDWVQHTVADEAAYVEAVRQRSLMAMRQAAYQSPKSAKLRRLIEIVEEAADEGKKVLIFSFFLGVLDTVHRQLGASVLGIITGAVPPTARQEIVDRFTRHEGHGVVLSQIEAGGVGINLQTASIVIITEPQWKPSTEDQAVARAHRMGQVRTVQVHRLLAKDSVDERMREIQENKALLFAEFARKSDAKDADRRSMDTSVQRPAVLDDERVPREQRIIVAEEFRLAEHQLALQ